MDRLKNLLRTPWPWGSEFGEAERRANSPLSDVSWGGLTRKKAASLLAEQKSREVVWRSLRKKAASAVAETLGVSVERANQLMANTASLTRMRAPSPDPSVVAPLWWKMIRFAQEGGTVTA